MEIEYVSVNALTPYANNARTHSPKQIDKIARSIQRFGFTNAILVTPDLQVMAGHGRLVAAKKLGMTEVPVVRQPPMSADELRAYTLADNQIALAAGWDQEILAIEFQLLIDADFDMDATGFTVSEIDVALNAAREASPDTPDKGDVIPPILADPVSRSGDMWLLERHRLVCGDARHSNVYRQLLGDTKINLIFTDPPYNVPVKGHISGSGKHREFAMASGEMSEVEFITFLAISLGSAACCARDGALAYVFMDWRHIKELMHAGELVFDELKQPCVWNKQSGAQGSFYRSQHELVFVYKIGTAPHLNNFGLGEGGRYRTNVFSYPGNSGFSKTRATDLAMHPTVKPLKLVIDAIEDCTRRGGIVLDCFAGSGTTLMAADRCGRTARVIEYDPLYCDVIIRRFQALTGKGVVLAGSGKSFDDVARDRIGLAA